MRGRACPLIPRCSPLRPPLSAKRARPLKGRVRPPGDKSISHRAFCSAFSPAARRRSKGCSRATTCCGPARLARRSARRSSGARRVHGGFRGPGLGAILSPRGNARFRQRRHRLRLMMGVVGGHGMTATFDGDASLRKRPMRRILDPLRLMGAAGPVRGGRRTLSDRAQGRPRSGAHRISHAGRLGADQVGRAARRASTRAGKTTVIEAEASRDHTEKMLAHFGAEVTVTSEGRRAANRRSSAARNCVRRPWLFPPTRRRPRSPSSPPRSFQVRTSWSRA